MTHYSDNEAMVRVDLFKPSGKWSQTYAIDMSGEYKGLIHDNLRNAFLRQYPNYNLPHGWSLICLQPYHEHSHPITLKRLYGLKDFIKDDNDE